MYFLKMVIKELVDFKESVVRTRKKSNFSLKEVMGVIIPYGTSNTDFVF